MTKPSPIVFLVMSAVQSAATVDQLAASLAPHRVLVHHDFSQKPEFRLVAPNAVFVPYPKKTGWGTWGFTEAILYSLQFALESCEFEYLQLLSPTCLPIKPMKAFEAHVMGTEYDAHFAAIDLLADRDALMTVGYRAFAKRDTLRFRALRRLSRHYFAADSSLREVAGICLDSGVATNKHGSPTLISRLALRTLKLYSHAWLGRHVFDANLRPCFGSVWFGAKRAVVSRFIQQASDARLQACFSRIHLPEEFLFASVLTQASESHGPLNHLVNSFDQANPRRFVEDDFARLENSPAFFARKFADDPTDSLRLLVLRNLAHAPPASQTSNLTLT